MLKRIAVLLFVVQVSLGQNNVLNDITITPLKGYEYRLDESNKFQATFINPQGFKLYFFVAKITDSNITTLITFLHNNHKCNIFINVYFIHRVFLFCY